MDSHTRSHIQDYAQYTLDPAVYGCPSCLTSRMKHTTCRSSGVMFRFSLTRMACHLVYVVMFQFNFSRAFAFSRGYSFSFLLYTFFLISQDGEPSYNHRTIYYTWT
jgi:hypothetical protein